MGKIQGVYTKEFKQEAVRLAQTSGKSIVQVARETFASQTPRFINGVKNWRRTAPKRSQAKGITSNSKKKIAA